MKLEVLVANEEALKVLTETKFDDAQLTWDLADTFDEVEKAITKFQKNRDDYVRQHGKTNPDNPDRYNMPNPEEFTEYIKKLLQIEIDIVFPLIPFNELKSLKPSVKELRSWKALGLVTRPVKVEDTPEKVEDAEEVKEETFEPENQN
jgi:sulfatase maturation enzyme AslB (radical SAM superfamily)